MLFKVSSLIGVLLTFSTVSMAMDDPYGSDLAKIYQNLKKEFPSLNQEQFWQLYELHGGDEKKISQTIELTQQPIGFEHLYTPYNPPIINQLYGEIEKESRQFFLEDPLAFILASKNGPIKPCNVFLLKQFEVKLEQHSEKLTSLFERYRQFEEAIPKMKKGLAEMISWFSEVKNDESGNFMDSNGKKFDLATYLERQNTLVVAQEQFEEFNVEFSKLESAIKVKKIEEKVILDHITFLREQVNKDKVNI